MAEVEIPHFAIPFRIAIAGTGSAPSALVTEQDTEDEIMDCIEAIVRFEQGHRIEKPEFGVSDQMFIERTPDPNRYWEAIERWEPRSEILVESEPNAIDSLVSDVLINVQVTGD